MKKFEDNFKKFSEMITVFEEDYTILKSQREDSIKEYISNIAYNLTVIANKMKVTFEDNKFTNQEKLNDQQIMPFGFIRNKIEENVT